MKSASPNPWPLMYQRYGQAAIPEELAIAEIHDIGEAFGKAAKRAKDAGFEVATSAKARQILGLKGLERK